MFYVRPDKIIWVDYPLPGLKRIEITAKRFSDVNKPGG
jgi:hypothetical protein